MAYEILALDIDGTITDSNRELPEAVRQGLIDIQKAGKKIVLATGRADSGVAQLIQDLEMDKYGSYVATYNGAKLRQCDTGEVICNLTFPQEMIRPVFEVVRCYSDVDMTTVTTDAMYSYFKNEPNKYTQLESGICGFPITKVEDPSLEIYFPVNAFLVTAEPSILVTVCEQLNMIFSSVLDIYLSDPYFLEVMPKDISKAHSLGVLLEHLGMTQDNLIACGDGQNDISMIQFAGLGVAMENASDKVKNAADYITLSNDENGVLHVIEKFMKN